MVILDCVLSLLLNLFREEKHKDIITQIDIKAAAGVELLLFRWSPLLLDCDTKTINI